MLGLYKIKMMDTGAFYGENYYVLAKNEDEAWKFVVKNNISGPEFAIRPHEITVYGEGEVITEIGSY